MPGKIPSEKEVLGYFKSFSNWGRWGEEDQLGTLNFVTPQKTRRAVGLVREGVTLSCARTIRYDPAPDVPIPPLHYMIESGEGWASGEKVSGRRTAASSDFIGVAFHGHFVTHMDSLAHFFWEGKMYNGRPAHMVSTSLGATYESIELVKNGVAARGVLVDVPMVRGIDWVERGEGVMPQDIEAAEKRCGFRVEEGDVLLVRTGQLRRREVEGPADPNVAGSTACQAACLPLFHQRSIAVIGSDTGNDVMPSAYEKLSNPIHQVGIVAMGLWILDNANLEDLARACQQRNRWEFLININPLRMYNATGSPVNPVAVF
jgi:kynurenine formamidase